MEEIQRLRAVEAEIRTCFDCWDGKARLFK